MLIYIRTMVLIKKKLILSTKKEQGAVAVEISLIFFPFIFIILFMFEICRVIYISSALDLAVAEASRYAAISQISEVGYQKVFIDKLNKDIPLMPLLTADKNIYVNVNYCSTIEDVIINNCDSISNEKTSCYIYSRI
ncbi:Flp pilus assembly protein TadG [Serratia fonticola]|uniref:Flp pilus assembly protein TadG n=1 Tax=Serratia fonticola TaxID=47917 RepID=A0A4U9WE08_SERFO|nr:Flp pilus assembly protein TadG [Serratia fonticola]